MSSLNIGDIRKSSPGRIQMISVKVDNTEETIDVEISDRGGGNGNTNIWLSEKQTRRLIALLQFGLSELEENRDVTS